MGSHLTNQMGPRPDLIGPHLVNRHVSESVPLLSWQSHWSCLWRTSPCAAAPVHRQVRRMIAAVTSPCNVWSRRGNRFWVNRSLRFLPLGESGRQRFLVWDFSLHLGVRCRWGRWGGKGAFSSQLLASSRSRLVPVGHPGAPTSTRRHRDV